MDRRLEQAKAAASSEAQAAETPTVEQRLEQARAASANTETLEVAPVDRLDQARANMPSNGSTDEPEQISFGRIFIEKALSDLPAIPGIISKVLEETDKEDPSASALEKLISADQALVSKVLRVVNSAYYGLPGQITSVGQAVVILGLQQVRNLVLSVGAISSMPIRTQRQHDTLQQFWIHSFGTAAATQLVAKKKGVPTRDSESMFVGGLLHDIGRLFVFSHFPETYDRVLEHARETGCSLEDAERVVMEMTHGEIGALMAEKWQLPEILSEIIRDHEGPFIPGCSPVLYTVHIGDAITKHLYTDELPTEEETISQVALDWLDFDEEEFAWLKAETEQKVQDASSMFGMLAA